MNDIKTIEAKNTNDISTNSILSQYYLEIGKYPLLNPDEERSLFIEYKQNNNQKIKEILINSNLRLVVSVAKEYIGVLNEYSYDFIDLIQEGNTGLIEAINRFDPQVGCKLSVYARFWIKQKIISFIKSITDDKRKSDFEIISLDNKVYSDSEKTFDDLIPSKEMYVEDKIISKIIQENVLEIMKEKLTEKEYRIITLRFGFVNEINTLGNSMKRVEIAKILGVTLSAIRQTEIRALKKLEQILKKQGYEQDYLNSKQKVKK